MVRRSLLELGVIAVAVGIAAVATASETINYSYDAKGRLVKVARSGNVNNGVNTSYTFDKADNRTNVMVNGSSNTPPP